MLYIDHHWSNGCPTESQSASNACREEETRLIRDMQGGLAIQAAIQDLQVWISDPRSNKLRGYVDLERGMPPCAVAGVLYAEVDACAETSCF